MNLNKMQSLNKTRMMKKINLLCIRHLYTIVISVWVIIAAGYCIRVPIDHIADNFWSHVENTKIIVTQHRLPFPNEGQEAVQMPLYYLLNSLIVPRDIMNNVIVHINFVKALSILYGAISLIVIGLFLKEVTNKPGPKLLSLLFIATTPNFIIIFTMYNNDSLEILLSILLSYLSYKLYNKWSWFCAIALFITTVIALYVKLTALFSISIVLLLCLIEIFCVKKHILETQRIIITFFISILFLLPWLVFNNHKNSGQLILLCPPYSREQPNTNITVNQIKQLIGITCKISALQPNKPNYINEWDDPWPHTAWYHIHPSTKRYDYWAYTFISSIIGDATYTNPSVLYIWIIYWIHLIAYLGGLVKAHVSRITQLSGFSILLTYLFQILSVIFFLDLPHRSMTYRYIAWNFAPWAILYTNLLCTKLEFSFILKICLLIGILI